MSFGNTGLGIDLNLEAFEGQINNRGLQVTHEYAMPCPCQIQRVEDGAVGSPNVACSDCFGRGYIFRDPVLMTGLIANLSFGRNHLPFGWVQPGDLTFGPSTKARKITDFDRITLSVGTPTDPQVIVRGESSTFTLRPEGLESNEDLLYWESSEGHAIYLEDINKKVYTNADYRLDGRKIVWAPGAGPAIGTTYAIKYCAFPEYTAWVTPTERWDRKRSLGQSVMLRKIALDTDLSARRIHPPWRERVESNLKNWDDPFVRNDSGKRSNDPQR